MKPVYKVKLTYKGHKIVVEKVEPELFNYYVDGRIGGEHTDERLAMRCAKTMIDNM